MKSIYKYLQSITWLRRLHQWYYSNIRILIWDQWRRILLARVHYWLLLNKVRITYGKRKLRVIFPVSNVAKWKCQSLYDLMQKSDKYEPIVALTPMDIEVDKSSEEQTEILEKNKKFFDERGCKWVVAYDPATRNYKKFSEFGADIVWYTQPWNIDVGQDAYKTSKHALTCYVPYFVQNYGGLDMDCEPMFHRMQWRHFTLSESWAKVFMEYQGRKRSGVVKGLGHPMLDNFYIHKDENHERRYVIYAPHWSCNTLERYSTFLKNGREILDLAKNHPEISWVFKPHPTLRNRLITGGLWPKDDVDAYYKEWESLGSSCYDGNYIELFQKSVAMITDCASFLVEYACTGNPIIHLVSSNAKYQPHPIAAKLFGSYYQAHNWDEFRNHFDRVILGGDDYKREERLAAVNDMRLLDNYAAKNILDYLDKEFAST